MGKPLSTEQIKKAMKENSYICDDQLAFIIYLSLAMEKPLLLEGEPGVGKTEVAKVLSGILGRKLIRLQCYEGLDANATICEWNYAKQLLKIKTIDVCGPSYQLDDIFTEEFLIARPLLTALRSKEKVVLLIDEIDRADEEFEAFLLEILSDFQITIPEMGTIKAIHKPLVIITSNQVRELHDALKRRCLYHYIDYPDPEREMAIIKTKIPAINDYLAKKIAGIMTKLRNQEFYKRPGVSETLDWSQALTILEKEDIDEEVMDLTCGCLFKFKEDVRRFKDMKNEILIESEADLEE
ncbi:MAG: MoxR family ATPase [Proteobacteria bacterium]|nr:MoxR family ATPase [Pseudomonadota bacterium]MBU4011785.1 MoxR family ATPase [Pseudomonadota bacterium]